jgi:chromosome segregation ATPase
MKMPEDNEKIEDFISLWRKKMKNDMTTPSAIGETLDRIKEIEKENEELRNRIKENIELISKTEKIVQNTIEENERLNEQIKQGRMTSGEEINNIQRENVQLNNTILTLERNLTEKEVEIRARNNEITELKIKLEEAMKSIDSSSADKDADVTAALIEDLQSELSRKKSQIEEFENKISELTEENESLNQQLIEKMKKLPIDYVVPVEQPKPSVIKPQSTKPTSQTLEILCQDLQTDLNKYKKIVEKLNKEKSELEQTLESGGFKLEPEEIKELKKENKNLKNEILQIQKSLKIKQEEEDLSSKITEAEKKITNLQEQLKEKNQLLKEIKDLPQTQPIIHKGPMADLVEDLQSKINKLKITIEEKNKIIEELKSS